MTETSENFGVESRIRQYILHHWWISVIWRMLNYRRNSSNTKIELYFEEIPWKTIQNPIHRTTIISITMTAAKVMDIIARLSGWAGHVADTVSAYTQNKKGRYSKITDNSKVGMSRYWDDTSGLNHGPVWKTQSFLLSEIFTIILLQDSHGKVNSRKFY